MANEDLLHELAVRLLKVESRRGHEDQSTLDLMVGELPPNLPVSIPIKDEWRVLGSMQHHYMKEYTSWTIILDAPGNPEAVKQRIIAGLMEQGWKESSLLDSIIPNHGNHGGFMALGQPSHDLWKNIASQRKQDPNAPVELSIESEQYSGSLYLHVNKHGINASDGAIVISNEWASHLDLTRNRARRQVQLPNLTAPEGVAVMPAGSSSGGVEASAHARAYTEMGVAEMEAHYARQLEEAGWERVDGGAEDRFAWSIWHISADLESKGYLFVLQGMEPNSRRLSIEMQATLGGQSIETLLENNSISTHWTFGFHEGEEEDNT